MDTTCASQASLLGSLYRYRSLKGEPDDTIRLLTILPGDDDHITCAMSLARLSQNPEFNAFSYMWGKQEANEAIVIEG